MRVHRIALCFTIAVISSTAIFGGEAERWKEESTEAAEQILQKARAAVGEMRRFETDFLIEQLDNTFGTITRGRGHIYFEAPFDGLYEMRPIESSHNAVSQRERYGKTFQLREMKPETWIWAKGAMIQIDEISRTYETLTVTPEPPKSRRSGWAVLENLCFARTCCDLIPPWLDPNVDWKELQSMYRIAKGCSTASEFAVIFVPKNTNGPELRRSDAYLAGKQILALDQQTLHPKKWGSQDPAKNERTILYTRFDINPPHRELKIDLSRYRPQPPPPPPSPAERAKSQREEQERLAFAGFIYVALKLLAN